MKTAKKQFLASVVSLLLCVSMLVGTTFAWFTDSVASNNNFIKSGNLDVTLEYYDGTQWQPVEEDTALIDNGANWEPGFAQVVYLRIANAGSLALKYQLSANVLADEPGTNVEGNEFYLSNYIKFGVKESANAEFYSADKAGRDAAVADVDADANLISSADKATGELLAGESTFVTYVVYMPTSVGNVANHDGRDVPEIKLGVNVAATQLDYEGDDFGTDYDDATTYPVVSAPVTRPAAGGSESVSLKAPVENAVEVVLPAALVDALPANVTSMGIAYSEPKVDTANNTVTFDSIEVVDQNGNVIDLADLTLTEDITVTIPLGDAFEEGKLVGIYHDGEFVASVTVDQNGMISYDVAHLCEVAVVGLEDPTVNETTGEIEIGTVGQLLVFANDVNKGNTYKGKTVVLTSDIDLGNMNWTTIGTNHDVHGSYPFSGTFDGKGHTVSNLYISIDDNQRDSVGFIGCAKNATIKGLTIENVYINADYFVGAVVGKLSTGKISDCHVKGQIDITARRNYAAGIVGDGYYTMENCSVIANEMGKITSAAVSGGLCGRINEGSHSIKNCTVKNMDIKSGQQVAALSGFVHYGNTISGCTAENVNLTLTAEKVMNPAIGLASGLWYLKDGKPITLSNNVFKNITISAINDVTGVADILYGWEWYDNLTGVVDDNNTMENVTNNLNYQ
jgi:predicted ribosomally synthesized peptide with SipW-like signal peptide